MDVGKLCRSAKVGRPVRYFTRLDGGFGQVVDYQREIGECPSQLDGVFQVLHIKEQIEWYGMFLKYGQSAEDQIPHDKIVIRFILCNMPDTNELRVLFEG